MKYLLRHLLPIVLLLGLVAGPSTAFAQKNVFHAAPDDGPGLSTGQTLYVPAYSHIYIGHKAIPYMLTVTLSIRNINPDASIIVDTVDYYGTKGELLKHHLDAPMTLDPMATIRYVVPAPDKAGGSGANFIVKWRSAALVNQPIVETIMIGTQSQQGISFTSRARPILPTPSTP